MILPLHPLHKEVGRLHRRRRRQGNIGIIVSVSVCMSRLLLPYLSTDLMLVEVLLYQFRSTETIVILGTGAQDVHLDFHRAPELRLYWSRVEIGFMPL